MRLLAIANISDRKKTIGLRLFDIDNGEVRDVPIENIKQVLNSGRVIIENITIKNGEVAGSNGSIDRLPKLVNGILVGHHTLTVAHKLGNVGYTLVNYEGQRVDVLNENVKSSSIGAISNGRITQRGNTTFISPIEGSYKVIDVQIGYEEKAKVARQPAVIESYDGELVSKLDRIKPVIINDPDTYFKYNIYSYNDEKIEYAIDETMMLNYNRREITNGALYETNKYTLHGKVYRELSLYIEEDNKEIRELLRMESTRDSIDASITKYEALKSRGRSVDKETGILIPIKSAPYPRLIVTEFLDKSKNQYEDVSQQTIDKYIKILKVMDCSIYSETITSLRNLALVRKCTKKGIEYRVLQVTDTGWSKVRSVSIEDIYANHTKYQNVLVTNSEILIKGLDGTYKYDIEKVYEAYNTELVKSSRAIKAKLVDPLYKEVINARGDLLDLSSGSENLIIPQSVKNVTKKSIKLTNSNTTISFGSSIENCSTECINWSKNNLRNIIIDCDKKPGLAALRAVTKIFLQNRINVTFNRDISPREYAYLLFTHKDVVHIESNNLQKKDDTLILDTVKIIVKENLHEFEILKNPIEYSVMKYYIPSTKTHQNKVFYTKYSEHLHRYNKFKEIWNKELEQLASKSLQDTINKLIENIDQQIDIRKKEFEKESGFKYVD